MSKKGKASKVKIRRLNAVFTGIISGFIFLVALYFGYTGEISAVEIVGIFFCMVLFISLFLSISDDSEVRECFQKS